MLLLFLFIVSFNFLKRVLWGKAFYSWWILRFLWWSNDTTSLIWKWKEIKHKIDIFNRKGVLPRLKTMIWLLHWSLFKFRRDNIYTYRMFSVCFLFFFSCFSFSFYCFRLIDFIFNLCTFPVFDDIANTFFSIVFLLLQQFQM